jgi:hypothetical protein
MLSEYTPFTNITNNSVINKSHCDYLERVGRGFILEAFVKYDLESKGFNIKQHFTTQSSSSNQME